MKMIVGQFLLFPLSQTNSSKKKEYVKVVLYILRQRISLMMLKILTGIKHQMLSRS